MFFAMNRFRVRPERGAEFEERWKNRDSHLRGTPGFLDFWLLRSREGGEYISCSRWESAEAFRAWTESERFRAGHASPLPEGVVEGPPRFAGYEVVLGTSA